jgi:hypothetical protein
MAAAAKRGTQKGHKGPPAQCIIPNDIKVLGESGKVIANSMRAEHSKRMAYNRAK